MNNNKKQTFHDESSYACCDNSYISDLNHSVVNCLNNYNYNYYIIQFHKTLVKVNHILSSYNIKKLHVLENKSVYICLTRFLTSINLLI